MKPAELKPIKVGYGEEQIAFYPQMATESQMEEFQMRFAEIGSNDDQKYQKFFDIHVEAIAECSAEPPKRVVKEKGEAKYLDLVEDAETTLDAMKRFFDKQKTEDRRVIKAAYNAFVASFEPDVNFDSE